MAKRNNGGVTRNGNRWKSTWRDPRTGNTKPKTACWPTSDRKVALEWKQWLDLIRKDKAFWDRPPTDTPTEVLTVWFKGRQSVLFDGFKIPTSEKPDTTFSIIVDPDGNEIVDYDVDGDVPFGGVIKTDEKTYSRMATHTILVAEYKKLRNALEAARKNIAILRSEVTSLQDENRGLRVDQSLFRKSIISTTDRSIDDVFDEYSGWFSTTALKILK